MEDLTGGLLGGLDINGLLGDMLGMFDRGDGELPGDDLPDDDGDPALGMNDGLIPLLKSDDPGADRIALDTYPGPDGVLVKVNSIFPGIFPPALIAARVLPASLYISL